MCNCQLLITEHEKRKHNIPGQCIKMTAQWAKRGNGSILPPIPFEEQLFPNAIPAVSGKQRAIALCLAHLQQASF